MGSSNERAKRAIEAMKPLGFSRKLSIEVLKRLLNLYSNNWDMIEDDNYRVLADGILDAQEDAPEETGGSIENPQDPKPVTTRAVVHENYQAQSGACAAGPSTSKRPRLEEEYRDQTETEAQTSGVLVRKRLRKNSTMDGSTSVTMERADLAQREMPTQVGMGTITGTSIDPHTGRTITYQKVSSSKKRSNSVPVLLKQPKLEPGTEPDTQTRGHQDSVPEQSGTARDSVPKQGGATREVQLGSSSNGEIKMVFRFPNFPNMPELNLDDLFKMVENQNLKSFEDFRILNPDFSIPYLMNLICQAMAEQVSKE